MSDSIWQKVSFKLQTSLPNHVYQSFVEPVNATEMDPDNIELSFRDRFSKDSFEQKCLPLMHEILHDLKMEQVNVALSVLADATPVETSLTRIADRNPFDPKYTFETFVIGSTNQFAHAACQAVSRQPGQCYNPLFIFGGAGLGKTHLLKAIGYEIHKQQSNLRILFLTSEAFTNELIQAIRVDKMREFREKYRTGCDVLLLDDIHFLAGKERTQEEFFYTFNYLHESRKQIVITSDRYPKDIQGLENRLQTRFEWGLVADVQPPEVETRIAILKNKADKEAISLPNDVAEYVASHITTNIRELEGSLHRLQAYAAITNVPITYDLALQVLKDLAPKMKHELTPDGIIRTVALHFNVKGADIRSDKRVRKLSGPRQICMYLLRKHLQLSSTDIAKLMGKKDHTTVLHGVKKIAADMRCDTELMNHITSIEGLFR